MAADKQQFIDDQCQRNAIEAKIGQGKRCFGLGLIREKLPAAQSLTIALNVLVIPLVKLLELHFGFLAYWLQAMRAQYFDGLGFCSLS